MASSRERPAARLGALVSLAVGIGLAAGLLLWTRHNYSATLLRHSPLLGKLAEPRRNELVAIALGTAAFTRLAWLSLSLLLIAIFAQPLGRLNPLESLGLPVRWRAMGMYVWGVFEGWVWACFALLVTALLAGPPWPLLYSPAGQVLESIFAGTRRLLAAGCGTSLWVMAVVVLYALARLVISHGHVHSILREHCHPAVAALATALIFAGGYLISPFVTPLALLNLVLAGLVLERLGEWTGSLWHPYGMLTGWVWLGLVTGQPLQGMPLVRQPGRPWVFGSLPAALSGGVYGFEGGLVVTVMLAAGLLALLRARPRMPVRLTPPPPPEPIRVDELEPTL